MLFSSLLFPCALCVLSLSLSLSFPPPPRPQIRIEREFETFPPICEDIDDDDDDDAFADDDFVALLWKRNNATVVVDVVVVYVELGEALLVFFVITSFTISRTNRTGGGRFSSPFSVEKEEATRDQLPRFYEECEEQHHHE